MLQILPRHWAAKRRLASFDGFNDDEFVLLILKGCITLTRALKHIEFLDAV